jgi:hypothetical protein
VTFATYNDPPAAGFIIDTNLVNNNPVDIWYKGLEAFLKHANRFADLGLFVYYEVQAIGNLHIRPGVGFNETAKSMSKIVKPLLDDFDKIGLNYTTSVAEFDTFFDLYLAMFEDELAGRAPLSGGIGMTRDDMADQTDQILGAYKTALENNVFLVGHLFNAGRGHGATDSAKHPVWNNVTNFVITSMTLATDLTLKEKQQAQHTLTNVVDESFRKASPHAISYVNEVSSTHKIDWHLIVKDANNCRAIHFNPTGKTPSGDLITKGL